MINLTLDLIHLARYLLVPKGRLVFMLPTMSEDWDEVDLPPVEGMRELKVGSGSVQDFHGWGRRVRQRVICDHVQTDRAVDHDGEDRN
jgi:tRNA (guanine10-N2)-methyltransferase